MKEPDLQSIGRNGWKEQFTLRKFVFGSSQGLVVI